MFDNEKPLVSICCITYNHEKYIAQCLDGFLMQKTTFQFEIVISNDCSTDNTQRIIQEYVDKYPHIFRDISPTENLGMNKNFYYTLTKCGGKYIAYCEGDDYWIDENKLQMQVDFLERNPDYGMCYTKTKQYNQKVQKFCKKAFGSEVPGFEYLLSNGNWIPTLTTIFRKDLLDKYLSEIQPRDKGWLMGDYPMWLFFSHESKMMFFDKVTTVYRVLENSASHFTDINKIVEFKKSIYEIMMFYDKYYNLSINFVWDENSQFVRTAFIYGKRSELLLYDKPVVRTMDKAKLFLAKSSICFNISLVLYKIFLKIVTFVKCLRGR
mgnify:CR=1 FL=1